MSADELLGKLIDSLYAEVEQPSDKPPQARSPKTAIRLQVGDEIIIADAPESVFRITSATASWYTSGCKICSNKMCGSKSPPGATILAENEERTHLNKSESESVNNSPKEDEEDEDDTFLSDYEEGGEAEPFSDDLDDEEDDDD